MPDRPADSSTADDLVRLGPGIAQDPDELRGRRLRGRRQLPGRREAAVELLRLELHPVPKGLVPEHDLQRDQGDVVPVEHAVGEIGGAVGDHGDRAALRVRQAPVLGPHVVGLGGLHPSPPGRIAKDGLRGVGVHMDLEDVRRATATTTEPPNVCMAARTSFAAGRCSPRTSTSVQYWKSRSAAISTVAAGMVAADASWPSPPSSARIGSPSM